MEQAKSILRNLSEKHEKSYLKDKIILSFEQYIEIAQINPERYIRNAPQYLLDIFKHYKKNPCTDPNIKNIERFGLFDLGTSKGIQIVGGEQVQAEIYKLIDSCVKHGFISKLILLHGPNGSAKTSTIETIANAMQLYSTEDEGAIYRFSWIFPTDKNARPISSGESQPIGFGIENRLDRMDSYALLDETKIASKIISELKENPIFLIPMPYREQWLKQWIAAQRKCHAEDVDLAPHILEDGLSKRNQQIFNVLLNAYGGNLNKVYQHVQVERFFFSRQYRVGISTIEPQMAIDAREKQITLDKNYSNLPAVLHTINFYQSEGELIEANRGIIEFSDLLKRPVETFKYLLNTLEKQTINLFSGIANLDVVFLATTNEKHLDSFKTIPDFSSFKGRFELVTVPYLLSSELEEKIYERDIEAIAKTKKIAPHTLALLCSWAVMTRLKQPDPENYPKEYRTLIAKLDPHTKSKLYNGQKLEAQFSLEEQNALREIRSKIWNESQGMVVYEGRFGASPREIRSILHRAALNPKYSTLTPMAIFYELNLLAKDRTVYDFLQFEPRGQYHDAILFIELIKKEFIATFKFEAIQAMSMADENEYLILLKRYVDHVVAQIKKERIWDEGTSAFSEPSENLMSQIEKILDITKPRNEHRNELLSRIAAYKLEHPDRSIVISEIFEDFLIKIKRHYYIEKEKVIFENFKCMIARSQNDTEQFSTQQLTIADETYRQLEERFGYDRESAFRCLQYLLKHKNILDNTEKKTF